MEDRISGVTALLEGASTEQLVVLLGLGALALAGFAIHAVLTIANGKNRR